MIFLTALYILLGIIFSFLFYKFIRNKILLYKLPTPTRSSIFGNLDVLFQPDEIVFQTLGELCQKYPVFSLTVEPFAGIILQDPNDLEAILTNKEHNRKSALYWQLERWLRTGLLTSHGEKWNTRRRILTPAFHFNILKGFVSTFHEESLKLVENINNKTEKCTKEVDICPLIEKFTLHTINRTSMGYSLGETSDEMKYKKTIKKLVKNVLARKVFKFWTYTTIPYFLFPMFYKERHYIKTLHNFTQNIINERKKTFDKDKFKEKMMDDENENNIYRKKNQFPLLDILLNAQQNGENIDDLGIREEVDTFMFEGHDTTSVAIAHCMMLLANNKDIQDRVVEEMDQIMGGLGAKPTFENLQKLEYTERCIKESLRLYPSVWVFGREMGEEFRTTSGYIVPELSIVMSFPLYIHRNPDIYPDPEKFDPDRFLPENIRNRHPFAYIPFSAGFRNCIGQKFAILEIKSVLFVLLSNFELLPVDGPSDMKYTLDIVLRPVNGIRMKFKERKKTGT